MTVSRVYGDTTGVEAAPAAVPLNSDGTVHLARDTAHSWATGPIGDPRRFRLRSHGYDQGLYAVLDVA